MNRTKKRILVAILAVLGVLFVAVSVFVYVTTSLFDHSTEVLYDVTLPVIERSTDPAVLARGKHLVESVGACASSACHGADLGGGAPIEMGPVATFRGPNITPAGVAQGYSDGELGRLITHGVKRDGCSVLFMPVEDFGWLSAGDVTAVVSYLRTVPAVDREVAPSEVGTLGKVLDRMGKLHLVVAQHIDHARVASTILPQRSANADYGALLARGCVGCHGEHFSGGAIPGAPSSMPIPANITPDASGLAEWTFDNFDHMLNTGLRRDGTKVNPFMPFDSFSHYDDTERHALWAYLRSLPPRPFGSR